MIIECPACGARAKLPESKEGAKVRCVECERVYVARPRGAKPGASRSSSSSLPVIIGTAVVVLIIVLFAVLNRGERDAAVADVVVEEERVPVVVDSSGWNSELVKWTRNVHQLAWTRDEFQLSAVFAHDLAWVQMQAAEGQERTVADWEALPHATKTDFVASTVERLVEEDAENLVGTWVPFDGEVLIETDTAATVRLTLRPREDDGGETRQLDWQLVRVGKLQKKKWKAVSWERYISPEEIIRKKTTKKAKTTTLSDGSVVLEAAGRELPHDADTPPEVAERIDALIDKLCDFSLSGRELSAVRKELLELGKPAIPLLLTRLYELEQGGFKTHEEQIAGQSVHDMLEQITGYETTFQVHVSLGATDERRESGVKQWFSWYDRKYRRFEAAPEEKDLLEELVTPKNEREQRAIDKARKELEDEKAKGKTNN